MLPVRGGRPRQGAVAQPKPSTRRSVAPMRRSDRTPRPIPGTPDASRLDTLLREALDHLHDPLFLQGHPLARLASGDPGGAGRAGEALRRLLIETIESFRPPASPACPPDARRRFRVLELRYLEQLPRLSIQDALGLSRSTYFR